MTRHISFSVLSITGYACNFILDIIPTAKLLDSGDMEADIYVDDVHYNVVFYISGSTLLQELTYSEKCNGETYTLPAKVQISDGIIICYPFDYVFSHDLLFSIIDVYIPKLLSLRVTVPIIMIGIGDHTLKDAIEMSERDVNKYQCAAYHTVCDPCSEQRFEIVEKMVRLCDV